MYIVSTFLTMAFPLNIGGDTTSKTSYRSQKLNPETLTREEMLVWARYPHFHRLAKHRIYTT